MAQNWFEAMPLGLMQPPKTSATTSSALLASCSVAAVAAAAATASSQRRGRVARKAELDANVAWPKDQLPRVCKTWFRNRGSRLPAEESEFQGKTKGQQLKGKIVLEFFTLFRICSHFFRIFPPGLSPSKQRV